MRQRIFSIKKLAVLAAASILSTSAFAVTLPCNFQSFINQGVSYQAVVYSYDGKALWLQYTGEGVANLGDSDMDKQIAFVCVKPGYQLLAYDGYNFSGKYTKFSSGTYGVPPTFQVSSVWLAVDPKAAQAAAATAAIVAWLAGLW
jgi:hypothetical protein